MAISLGTDRRETVMLGHFVFNISSRLMAINSLRAGFIKTFLYSFNITNAEYNKDIEYSFYTYETNKTKFKEWLKIVADELAKNY